MVFSPAVKKLYQDVIDRGIKIQLEQGRLVVDYSELTVKDAKHRADFDAAESEFRKQIDNHRAELIELVTELGRLNQFHSMLSGVHVNDLNRKLLSAIKEQLEQLLP